MDKIEDIRRRARRGQPAAQIARGLHVSEPTVREYRDMEDLSVRPRPRQGPQFPTPEGFRGTIGAWPIADSRQWRKQRHAATRVCVRLRDEGHYEGGYSTVQRYVHWKREQMALERDRRDASGYLLLRWLPGECQADFGEADFRVRGVTVRDKYLTASFPHPSVGLTQVLWGETPGCVCQGLRGVFEFVGGVPVRAAFGNATEVGRRLGTEIRVSRTSKLFASHYGLDHGFTNPRSGKGKGSVENMAGARRRATFVLVPSFHDVRKLNGRLLEDSLDLSDRRHYRLSVPRLELSGDDRAALPPSRRRRSAAVRWEARTRRASKRGRGGACGIHRYSVGACDDRARG